MKDFYFINLCLLLFLAFMYMSFRGGMDDYFRLNKISKTKIRKSKKGKKNYWWYKQLHDEYGFDKLYYLNKIFTIVYLPTVILHISIGWIKWASVPIGLLFSICFILLVPMNLFASIQNKLICFGRSFVWLARSPIGRHPYDSSLFDLFATLFPLVIIYGEFSMLNDIWHFIK